MNQTFPLKSFFFFEPHKRTGRLSRYFGYFGISWANYCTCFLYISFIKKNLHQKAEPQRSHCRVPSSTSSCFREKKNTENSDPEAAQLVARVRAGSVLHELQRDLKELEVQMLGWAQFFGGSLGFSKTDEGGG